MGLKFIYKTYKGERPANISETFAKQIIDVAGPSEMLSVDEVFELFSKKLQAYREHPKHEYKPLEKPKE